MTWVFTWLVAALFGEAITRKAAPVTSAQGNITDSIEPAYCVAAPVICRIMGWSVYNHIESRIVATRLSQARATTLCELLNLGSGEPARNTKNDREPRGESVPDAPQ